ncbi:MAG: hypothetical protein M3O68_01080 [Thermoproteota archaeon]|nr:hypothetical protein [Thermoproteota archaeon]
MRIAKERTINDLQRPVKMDRLIINLNNCNLDSRPYYPGYKVNKKCFTSQKKRIELINWVLQNMKNPNVEICNLIESRMNEIILAINQTYSIFESDKLHAEVRILDWIFYQVCISQQKSSKKELIF